MKKKKCFIFIFLLWLIGLSPLSFLNVESVNAEEEHTVELWVDSFTHVADDWLFESGNEPWLDKLPSGKRGTKWVFQDPNVMNLTSFTFQDLPLMVNFSVVSINLTICYSDEGQMSHYFGLHNGTWQNWVNYPTTSQTYPYTNWTSEISDYYDSMSAINNAKIKFMVVINSTNKWVYLHGCWLTVVYTGYTIHVKIRIDGQPPEQTLYAVKIGSGVYKDDDKFSLYNGNYSLSVATIQYDFVNWTVTDSLSVLNNQSKSTILTVEGTGTLTLHLRPIFLDWFMARTLMWLGLIGIFICILCPVVAFTKIKGKDLEGGAMWFLGVFVLGIPFIVAWLWG